MNSLPDFSGISRSMADATAEPVKLGVTVDGKRQYLGQGVLILEDGFFSETATVVLDASLPADELGKVDHLLGEKYYYYSISFLSVSPDGCQALFTNGSRAALDCVEL